MTDLPCSIAEDGYCHRHGVEHGLEPDATDDLPDAFMERPSAGAYESGYNDCLGATDAANLKRERDALQASLHELLTGPTLAFSEATADRMIQDTLRDARGES